MPRSPRRSRSSTLWIALFLTTLLGCSRISELLPRVDGSTDPLSVPSPTVVEETIGLPVYVPENPCRAEGGGTGSQ